MRLDTVTAEIRPRSDWEAVDLGFAMVRRSFWRCITVWWLAMGIPVMVGTVLLWDRPMLLFALFWWAKPAGSRLVLFELSRRLFGEEPSWKSVWREIPRAWWRRFFYRFLWARFSPWLPVTLAVEDLEGLRGKAYKQRCGQVVRRGEGVVMWMFFISDVAAIWCGLGLLALLVMLMPEGQDGAWRQALDAWDPNVMWEIPPLIARTVVGCVMAAMSLTDLFVIGAGFGVYINNRTWIEGWDVELAFKRLAQRLGKFAAVVMVFFVLGSSVQGAGLPVDAEAGVEEQIQTQRPPAEVIQQVKANEAFKVHTVTERVPKTKSSSSSGGLFPIGVMEILGKLFAVCVVALFVGFLGWMLWTHRHVFAMRGGGVKEDRIAPTARVVMGMEISPHTLPDDVPSAAWMLWQQGRHQEALGLLYRGSISRVMEMGRVEIQESDTEGDCMRRVEQAGTAAHPVYFRGITGMWIRLAYAGMSPADSEVRVVCEQWPFGGRRVP